MTESQQPTETPQATTVVAEAPYDGGRAKLVVQVLKQLPQLFAVRTIPALSTVVITQAIDVLAPILARLQHERDLRNSEGTGVDDAIKILTAKYSSRPNAGANVARIFRPEEQANKRFRLLEETIEIFQNRGRSTVSSDELANLVTELGCDYLFGPRAGTSRTALKIGIETALKGPGIGLQDYQSKHGRSYVLPARPFIDAETGELVA